MQTIRRKADRVSGDAFALLEEKASTVASVYLVKPPPGITTAFHVDVVDEASLMAAFAAIAFALRESDVGRLLTPRSRAGLDMVLEELGPSFGPLMSAQVEMLAKTSEADAVQKDRDLFPFLTRFLAGTFGPTVLKYPVVDLAATYLRACFLREFPQFAKEVQRVHQSNIDMVSAYLNGPKGRVG